MKTLLVSIILVSFFSNCQNEVPNFAPFEGYWRCDNEKIAEQWQAKSTSLYLGKSYSIENNDTLLQETITLTKKCGSYYYIPLVFSQNDSQEIPFTLKGYSKKKFVFENPNHDFPQRIIYDFINKNELLVTIESLDPANTKRVEFKFNKQGH